MTASKTRCRGSSRSPPGSGQRLAMLATATILVILACAVSMIPQCAGSLEMEVAAMTGEELNRMEDPAGLEHEQGGRAAASDTDDVKRECLQPRRRSRVHFIFN